MATHQFGGKWTAEKLDRLRKYLVEYRKIFSRNPRARHFTTVYVDAFAGTGSRVDSNASDRAAGLFADADWDEYKKGSAQIALELDPPFDKFIFIERNEARAEELRAFVRAFESTRNAVQVESTDANEFLRNWASTTDWRTHRAVVFLDPYGMQVEWDTLVSLARTRAVDLWLLFPLGVAVNRLLTREKPPPAWANALTRTFGTAAWEAAFYSEHDEATLFGVISSRCKDATWEKISEFFVARLRTIFGEVARNPLPLYNSTQTPIYLLCFAAGNPKGAPTAVKIAQHILKR